jgi:AraC family transcriptional activator of pobA
MTQRVPTYALKVLAQALPESRSTSLDVFMLDQRVEGLESTFGVPYRSNYYGIGICLQGSAEIAIDLEDCVLRPRSVLAMPPQAIKRWRSMTPDFEHVAIFFTKSYITERNTIDPDQFGFFESGQHVLNLSEGPAATIAATLQQLQHRYSAAHPYRDEILRASINVLLYELESFRRQHSTPPQSESQESRGKRLTAEFKRVVRQHFVSERGVAFYAKALCVTTRHLSATVREHTGKTAGDWIQEAVVLEARVLLQDATLTVAQVADALHFPDQSSFGKFFKNLIGVAPLAYRSGIQAPLTF